MTYAPRYNALDAIRYRDGNTVIVTAGGDLAIERVWEIRTGDLLVLIPDDSSGWREGEGASYKSLRAALPDGRRLEIGLSWTAAGIEPNSAEVLERMDDAPHEMWIPVADIPLADVRLARLWYYGEVHLNSGIDLLESAAEQRAKTARSERVRQDDVIAHLARWEDLDECKESGDLAAYTGLIAQVRAFYPVGDPALMALWD